MLEVTKTARLYQGATDLPALQISAFPTGRDIWRVDWFGPIAFPNRMERKKHPSVLVYLSKVIAPSPLEHQSRLLLPSCTLPANQQAKRWVSVGTTLLLRIGDLWQNQSLIGRPVYDEATFTDVTIDREHASLTKAGLSFEDGSFLLPLSHHPWHLHNTHSYCVNVKLPDDRILVVPCMELVRFYFGSSSELITRLFAPPLTRSRLYEKSYTSSKGRMNLELAERIPSASAEDIGRIAGSDFAWRAAALVTSSCLKASAAGRDIYPQTLFPFEGNTTLKAIGKWLPRGDAEQSTFLAYQILSCSHPFPFQSLHFKRNKGSAPSHGKNATNAGATSAEARPQRTAAKPKTSSLQEHDASSTLAATVRVVSGRRRFTDLEHKFIRAEQAIRPPAAPMKPSGSSPAVTDLATGDPGSSKRIRPVSLIDASAHARTEPPSFLCTTLAAMESIEGLQVSLLQTSEDQGWTVPAVYLADEDGVVRDQRTARGKTKKSRRVASFVLRMGTTNAIATVFEEVSALLILNSLTPELASNPTAECLRIAARGGSLSSLGICRTFIPVAMPDGVPVARHALIRGLADIARQQAKRQSLNTLNLVTKSD